MLRITNSLLSEVYVHCESGYPHECCGLLIGTMGEGKTVHAVRRCNNLNMERARDRYDLDPRDMLKVQREFEDSPWDILGIYHSHPDHPSRPSQTDTDRAWAGYSYAIISVRNGKAASIQSWVLNESDGGRRFDEEQLVIEDSQESVR